MVLRVIDTEPTGSEPPAEVIEVGHVDVAHDGDGWHVARPLSRLYRPLRGIPAETMAVHPITEGDIPTTRRPARTSASTSMLRR